jgi:hypothetical protein
MHRKAARRAGDGRDCSYFTGDKHERETMNQQTPKQPNANAVIVANDADLAALVDAAYELAPSDIVGLPLKYTKGKWTIRESKDNESVVGATDMFVVDVLSYSEGWVRWENKKRTHKIIARRIDGFISPPRHVLPEVDETEWPYDAKGPKDPWSEIQAIVMRDLTGERLVTWTSDSYGGRIALGALLKTFTEECRAHPGCYPVVLLESYDRQTAEFGKVATPRLKIVDWKPFGEGAAPAGDPNRAAAVRKQLESLKTLALPKPDAKTRRAGDDMDDEIPF